MTVRVSFYFPTMTDPIARFDLFEIEMAQLPEVFVWGVNVFRRSEPASLHYELVTSSVIEIGKPVKLGVVGELATARVECVGAAEEQSHAD